MAFIANCVTQGRRFKSIVLAALRAMGDREWTMLSDEFRLDVKWFFSYPRTANGISLIQPVRPKAHIKCNSSFMGGGIGSKFCYTWLYSQQHKKIFAKIHELEAVNILLAFKTLASKKALPGAEVTIWTDNSSSAYALKSGRTKDPTLAACSRELWLLVAISSQVITVRHEAGHLIHLADALSCLYDHDLKAHYARAEISHENLHMIPPVIIIPSLIVNSDFRVSEPSVRPDAGSIPMSQGTRDS